MVSHAWSLVNEKGVARFAVAERTGRESDPAPGNSVFEEESTNARGISLMALLE
jgi:hypothetical protein